MDKNEYKTQNEKRDADRKARLTERQRPWRPNWWRLPSDRFSFFIALFTGVLVLVSYCQFSEINRQSGAIERSSTAGRALVFVKINLPSAPKIRPIENSAFAYILDFSIENFGQTPAVLTKFETHVLESKTRDLISDAPVPGSPQFVDLREDSQVPAVSLRTDLPLILDEKTRFPVVIPANVKDIPLMQIFSFQRPPTITLKNGESVPVDTHSSWFYCDIRYQDIWHFERETVYYVGLFGSSVELPKDAAYNRWN